MVRVLVTQPVSKVNMAIHRPAQVLVRLPHLSAAADGRLSSWPSAAAAAGSRTPCSLTFRAASSTDTAPGSSSLLPDPATAPPLARLRLPSLLPSLAAPAAVGLAGVVAALLATPLLLLLLAAALLLPLSSHASSCAACLAASKQALLALLPVLLLQSCSSFRQATGAPAVDKGLPAEADAPAASRGLVSLTAPPEASTYPSFSRIHARAHHAKHCHSSRWDHAVYAAAGCQQANFAHLLSL
jgi:hypothetical protein